MNFTNENKLEKLEKVVDGLKRIVDRVPVEQIDRKISSERNMETIGGKYQQHIRNHLDIDNNKLGKTTYPYNGLILQSDSKVWLLEVDDNGDLQVTEQ